MSVKVTISKANRQYVVSKGITIMNKVIRATRDAALPEIKVAVIDTLLENVTYNGIIGGFEGNKQLDVQAHMGLDPAWLPEIENQIQDTLSNSIEIRKAPSEIGFTVTANKAVDNLLDLEIASYVSDSSGDEIPWLRWLIEGEGSVEAAILFKPIPDSRSGRAFMSENTDHPDWDISNYSFGEGANFIYEVLSSPALKARVKKILDSNFTRERKKYA